MNNKKLIKRIDKTQKTLTLAINGIDDDKELTNKEKKLFIEQVKYISNVSDIFLKYLLQIKEPNNILERKKIKSKIASIENHLNSVEKLCKELER